MNFLISPCGSAPADLSQISVVEVRDHADLVKGLFKFSFDRSHFIVLLGTAEIDSVVACQDGDSEFLTHIVWILPFFFLLFLHLGDCCCSGLSDYYLSHGDGVSGRNDYLSCRNGGLRLFFSVDLSFELVGVVFSCALHIYLKIYFLIQTRQINI